ncbi:uncharacterized protein LOC133187109 [Saccostrea echinata]|uniref:uncharacterized protein LOC133187109 n=1 Tax=Saccostrea echinata TaxID=191078 RepID=UPI002A828388|nr:uncharacterized protein LOC133187109 [Saccostrea echinata]
MEKMAAPIQSTIVDGVLKIALEIVEPSLKECSSAERREIEELMRNCALKEASLTSRLADISKLSDAELRGNVRKLLSEDDYRKISEYVDQETFTMDITSTAATFQRGNRKFLEPIQLSSIEAITAATIYQIASIFIESVFLVLGAIGIKVSYDEALMRKIIEEILPVVQQPAFRRIIDEFVETWAAGNAWGKAKAIFNLLKDTYSFGIFWKVVKIAFSEMSWMERIKNIALVATMIVAALATDGIALIAKIALSVNDAYNLAKKIINMIRLKALASEFNK